MTAMIPVGKKQQIETTMAGNSQSLPMGAGESVTSPSG